MGSVFLQYFTTNYKKTTPAKESIFKSIIDSTIFIFISNYHLIILYIKTLNDETSLKYL